MAGRLAALGRRAASSLVSLGRFHEPVVEGHPGLAFVHRTLGYRGLVVFNWSPGTGEPPWHQVLVDWRDFTENPALNLGLRTFVPGLGVWHGIDYVLGRDMIPYQPSNPFFNHGLFRTLFDAHPAAGAALPRCVPLETLSATWSNVMRTHLGAVPITQTLSGSIGITVIPLFAGRMTHAEGSTALWYLQVSLENLGTKDVTVLSREWQVFDGSRTASTISDSVAFLSSPAQPPVLSQERPVFKRTFPICVSEREAVAKLGFAISGMDDGAAESRSLVMAEISLRDPDVFVERDMVDVKETLMGRIFDPAALRNQLLHFVTPRITDEMSPGEVALELRNEATQTGCADFEAPFRDQLTALISSEQNLTIRHFAQESLDELDCLSMQGLVAEKLNEGIERLLPEEAALLVDQWMGYNTAHFDFQVAELAANARELLPERFDSRDVVSAINQVMFKETQWRGNVRSFYQPDNCFLSRMVERSDGLPVTVCLMFAAVARRLGLSFKPLGASKHFYLFLDSDEDPFVLDVFRKCREYSMSEWEALSTREEMPVCGNEEIVLRILRNILRTASISGALSLDEQVDRLIHVTSLYLRLRPDEHWLRLYLVDVLLSSRRYFRLIRQHLDYLTRNSMPNSSSQRSVVQREKILERLLSEGITPAPRPRVSSAVRPFKVGEIKRHSSKDYSCIICGWERPSLPPQASPNKYFYRAMGENGRVVILAHEELMDPRETDVKKWRALSANPRHKLGKFFEQLTEDNTFRANKELLKQFPSL